MQVRLIDANAFTKHYGNYYAEQGTEEGYIGTVADLISKQPTIKVVPVRRGKGCEYCKGRSYTKKPFTVITQRMKRIEVCFNFCPNCGAPMKGGEIK